MGTISRCTLLLLGTAAAMLLALAPAAEAAAEHWPTPVRYTLALRYHAGGKLTGGEKIAFRNDGPRTLRSVWLRLWPNGYGSCRRPWAAISRVRGGTVAGSRAGCTAVRVRLARTLEPGGSTALRMRLRVKAPPRPNRFGQEAGVAYLGNALPLLAVSDSGGAHIDPYTDLGDPFYSLSAAWSVRLDVPRGLAAATTGTVKSRRPIRRGLKRLRVSAARARDFAMVIGRLAVDTARTSTGVRLKRYRLRSHGRAGSLRTLRRARLAVESFTSSYGTPGLTEVDLVEGPSSLGPFGSGMEFPGLVLTSDEPHLIGHELAHQWWYGLVGNDQWREPWLDESIAEYTSRELPARVGGSDDLRCDLDNPVRPWGRAPLTESMAHWNSAGGAAYFRIVYLGGACALRSLERDLGPVAMTAFLRSYADAHRFGVASTADFVTALRAAAPAGYDVDGFLRRARITTP
jgi:hypothetical protein